MTAQEAPRTLVGLLRMRVELSPDEEAFGVPENGGYRMVGWRSFWSDALRVASGLRDLGVRRGDPVAILSAPNLEWELAHFGCLMAGAVVVGLDSNAPPARLGDTSRRAGIRAVIGDRLDLLPQIVDATAGGCRLVVAIAGAPLPQSGCRWIRWEDLLAAAPGADGWSPELESPGPEDVATIVFTSGTTGDQKGIPYAHGQIVRAVEAIVEALPEIGPDARLLCWLPLSAPFQRILDLCAVRRGATSYFVPDPELLPAAVRTVKPDLLIGVPRFYEKLASGIRQDLAAQPWPARSLARLALWVGRRTTLAGDRGPTAARVWEPLRSVMDRLILRRIRDALGGRVRFLVSGSAPLSPTLVEFFHACGLPMYEAYGVSEDIVPIAMNTAAAWRIGSVGRPLVEGSVKLGADGAVYVRDPGVFRGYLGDDAGDGPLTADGYYRTGDLGWFDDDGFLYLSGREGEIIKTSTGRRIALPKVETLLRDSPYVEQAVAIGAGRKCLVGLLTVDWKGLATAAGEQLPTGSAVPTRRAGQILLDGLSQRLRDLADYERPAAFLVLQEGFSVQHGELTPSFKLRRNTIEARYGAAIEALYGALEAGGLEDLPIRFISTAELRMLEFGKLAVLDRLRSSRPGRAWVVVRTASRVAARLAILRLRRAVGAAADRRRL